MRKSPPLKERDALDLFNTVEAYVPFDSAPKVALRQNTNGNKCIRFCCRTNRKEWSLDFYTKNFVVCHVAPFTSIILTTPIAVLAYLYRSLELNYDHIAKS